MKTYLKDGHIKIDNNLAENAIRPLTLSRKNFLFCGNHEAAEKHSDYLFIACHLQGAECQS